VPDRGGASNARPCPHANIYSAQEQGELGHRFSKFEHAIWIARHCDGRYRNFNGQAFWARGYYVSTVGRNEKLIRKYLRNQEDQDRREDGQLNLMFE
jgi:putative transposase